MSRTTKLLLILAGTFVVNGIAEAFASRQASRGIALIHGISIAIICYLWAKAEAQERGSVPPGRSALYAGLVPVVGVPVYLFRTRSAGKALAALGKAIALLFVLTFVSGLITEVLLAART